MGFRFATFAFREPVNTPLRLLRKSRLSRSWRGRRRAWSDGAYLAGTTTLGDRAGVRPSPGAAMFASSGGSEPSNVPRGSEAAAPGDGRTPVVRARYARSDAPNGFGLDWAAGRRHVVRLIMSESPSSKHYERRYATGELVRRLLALAWQFRGDCLRSLALSVTLLLLGPRRATVAGGGH